MCIFSGTVSSVANTRIFARSSAGGRQFLVYSMQYEAGSDLAMILPLPTPPLPPEDAVRFMDLSSYPAFFDDMATGFYEPALRGLDSKSAPSFEAILKVHEVGSFQASFVPRLRDFARLDSRFRLPDQTWEQMPHYHDYAFAVFKLRAGAKDIHPMAFEFPRRNPAELFFPTVHIHHGIVEARAYFDHSLYCQTPGRQPGWRISSFAPSGQPTIPAKRFMDIARTQGIVDGDTVVQFDRRIGMLANEDVILQEDN